MTGFIATVADCADAAKAAHNGDHDIALSFDEWGVWYSDVWNQQEAEWKAAASEGLHPEPWPKAPHLLEDIYSAADAVVEGSLMITLLKHCDRVRSASRAQLVNVIAPIMAEEQGPAWRQTVFYPFAEAAHHAKGTVYVPAIDAPRVHTEAYGDVDAVEAVVTWDEHTREGLLLVVNRDAEAAHTLSVDLSGLPQADAADMRITHAMMLHDDDPHRQNTAEQPDAVVPVPLDANAADGRVSFALPPISWAAVRFSAAPDSL